MSQRDQHVANRAKPAAFRAPTLEYTLQNREGVAQTYLDPRFQPTHHFRSFTLTVLLAVVTFFVALVLAAQYAPSL